MALVFLLYYLLPVDFFVGRGPRALYVQMGPMSERRRGLLGGSPCLGPSIEGVCSICLIECLFATECDSSRAVRVFVACMVLLENHNLFGGTRYVSDLEIGPD